LSHIIRNCCIKHKIKKIIIETAQVALVSVVIFYAGINLGFGSEFESQVNEQMLQSACFDLLTELRTQTTSDDLKQINLLENENSLNNNQLKLLNNPVNSHSSNISVPDTNVTVPDSTLLKNLDESVREKLSAKDSLKLKASQDSLRLLQMALDSTARLEYFHYQREDLPYVTLREKKKSKFFVEPSPNLKSRTVSIDSTGKYVEIKEIVAGKPNKIILRLPIDEYLSLRLKADERKKWEELGYAYDLKNEKVGLSELIKSFTDFEIPLPSMGLLSIFGPPKISLKVGGSVQIHGAWRNETTEGITASSLGNTRNEPDFKQQVQINVNGTIGDKLNILADWNTERTFQYENQLKIKYTGYEDEIIQSIEAGNVSLQTSPLVGGSDALFGIKAQFTMGPLTLTTIASQKKGETKEVSVSGGSTEVTFSKRAYEYSTNHYFVDTIYATPSLNVFNDYYGSATPIVHPDLFVTDIQVWKSVNVITSDRSQERNANVYINLDPIAVGGSYPNALRDSSVIPVPGQVALGRFVLLTPSVDYDLHPETGFITFKTSVNETDMIAVAYRQERDPNSTEDDAVYGEFIQQGDTNTTRRLVLKMIKPANLQPEFTTAWELQLKNIYPTGVRNIKQEGFQFDINREIDGQEASNQNGNVRFLNAFGLDILNSSGQESPDNVFDWRPSITIFPETGEVVFPTLRPFGSNIPKDLPAEFRYDDIYNETQTEAQKNKITDKWVLVGKSKGTASSNYSLGFNVVENSVKVLLNGRELTAGVDYSVDYNTGQLTIRNDAALVPGADLKITYEQNDLFALASKTLLGARGVFDISKKTKFGFSILNLNQQTLSDKVRIGEEPLSNTIYGLDLTTSADLPIVTKLMDNIFSTREMSTFNLGGEFAYINPDPNTKKSTISSDNGESIAYIDDFEGAKKTIPIGISYTSWKDISLPDVNASSIGFDKTEYMRHKGKAFWFTETPSRVTVPQIYGDRKQVATADQQVSVMDFVFVPDTAGAYNRDPNFTDKKSSWGGAQKILSTSANNLVDENIGGMEFWIQVLDAPPGAKLNIDLGRISEDVIPNNRLDTEDKDNNDAIDAAGKEDTGIDGINDEQERAQYGSTKADPNNDNFSFQRNSAPWPFDYFHINGTEGNAILSDAGRIPDTEDLNRNGNLDGENSYFRYVIPLDTTAQNPFRAGGGLTPYNWYLIRIPLRDSTLSVGRPSFSNVETIRMYIEGVDQMVHFRIGDFNLVGSQWQRNLPNDIVNNDSVLSISVQSLEENPSYTSPPGVFREKDRTQTDANVYLNEQSLSMIIKGLPEGESREIIKYLPQSLNVFNYSQMKLFIHGDTKNPLGNLAYNDTVNGAYNYSSEVYFRFGSDTNNCYEYRQPVLPDWNEITIDFEKLASIKQLKDSANQIIKVPVEGRPGHFYILRGNPSLTTVKFLSVGVYNIDNAFNHGLLSGEVWVNELRVIGADDSKGWAYSLNSSVKLADFANVSFNLSERSPFFHQLSDRFGSRVEQRNWAVATDINLLKILPFNMPEGNLRLNYSHTEQLSNPLYLPGSDVKVDEAVRRQSEIYANDTTGTAKTPEQIKEETQTQTISDSWSASNIKLKFPTKSWLIRDTFNALTMGINYNKSFSRSPTVLSNNSWIWNANFSYALSLSPDYYFQPVDIPVVGVLFALLKDYTGTKVYFTPQSISLALTARRNYNSNVSRPRQNPSTGQISPSNEITSRDFVTTRGFNFAWKVTDGGFLNLSTNYSLNISSSLAYLETYPDGTKRPESEIWKDIFGGASFGNDYNYQQNIDFRSAPRLPSLFDLNKYFTLNASYSVGYQWSNDFRQVELGRSAGFSNKTQLGMTIRWKSLFDPLFKESVEPNNKSKNTSSVNRQKLSIDQRKFNSVDSLGRPIMISDTTELIDSSLIVDNKKFKPVVEALNFLIAAVKYVFIDYELFSFNFSNDNTISRSGLKSQGTGFSNFWGFSYDPNAGPSRSFMLGLNRDVGPRAVQAGSNVNDVSAERNSFDFKTSRPLWEGAKIDITWRSSWSLNKNSTLTANDDGTYFISSVSSSGSISRSFLSLPPVLFIKSGIKHVAELFNPSDPNSNLSDAFVRGFESVPWFTNVSFINQFTKYIPRANWRISWDGLEKLFIFKSIAERVSLDHSYSSTYTEGWKLNRDGKQEVQVQKVQYGFAPLVGLNLTFGKLWGGNLSGNIKYSTTTSYDLGVTTSNITENFSKDIGFTFQYSKSGFELPLFGVSLKNDIEFSVAYSSTRNAAIRYNMLAFSEAGIPQDGTTRVTLEPRIKYTISAKVTLSVFYKRSSVKPEGASRITPTTTNEAGLDVNISIN
jgi:cell surface protein SprA